MEDNETALVPITQASMALAAARSFDDFRNVRDMASAAATYAKARGLGIDAENSANEYVVRAEREMGRLLIDMAESGERMSRGGQYTPGSPRTTVPVTFDVPKTLADLGLGGQAGRNDAANFQRLVRQWSDEEFERRLATLKEAGARLSKVDFYKGPRAEAQRAKRVTADIEETLNEGEPTDLFARFAMTVGEVTDRMAQFPDDELVKVAGLIRSLVETYSSVKAQRNG